MHIKHTLINPTISIIKYQSPIEIIKTIRIVTRIRIRAGIALRITITCATPVRIITLTLIKYIIAIKIKTITNENSRYLVNIMCEYKIIYNVAFRYWEIRWNLRAYRFERIDVEYGEIALHYLGLSEY